MAGPAVVLDGLAKPRTPRLIAPSEAELAAHAEFLKKLKEPLWLK
jgi:DNA polymerase-3 subunit epsilon